MTRNLENIDPETDALTGMFKEHDQALEAIQRVRELHKPFEDEVYIGKELGFICDHCYNEKYPCPTIQALDGEQ